MVIEGIYYGRSFSFLNKLINAQKEHPLSDYIQQFHVSLVLLSVIVAWFTIPAIHLIHYLKSGAHAFRGVRQDGPKSLRRWAVPVLGYSVLILVSIYFLIVFWGITYLTASAYDTFVYFDGAWRLAMGQVPHKDFHTPLGALSYLLPYWGLVLNGGFAGSIELVSFFVAVAFALISICFLWGRCSAFFSIMTVAYLSLLATVPMYVGYVTDKISLAMFYNRWGWAALTLILISYIRPKTYSTNRLILEAFLLALLLTFLIFLKITYAVIGLMFLPVLAFGTVRQRQLAISAGVITVLMLALVEWAFHITGPYIQDLRLAIGANGAVRFRYFRIFSNNAINATQFLLVLGSLIFLFRSTVLRWADLLFVLFVCAAGLVILDQNTQREDVIVLLAALLWSHAVASATSPSGATPERLARNRGAEITGILLVIFMVPQLMWGLRGISNITSGILPNDLQHRIAGLPGVRIADTRSFLNEVHAGADPTTLFNRLRMRGIGFQLSEPDYALTINEGLKLLKDKKAKPGKTITFDLANPFNFLTGGPPARGDYSWFHSRRIISPRSYIPAKDLFRDVDYIMVPTFPMFFSTTHLLLKLYGDYVNRNYLKLGESKSWVLYGRRE